MFPEDILAQAEEVLQKCRARRQRIVIAESCTGGLVAAALTAIAGSSDVVDRGFVTYSNQAKQDCLRVPAGLIATHGAVSEAVARAMAEGALAASLGDIAVSVTGIAGPGGGTPGKPVGLVWFGTAVRHGQVAAYEKRFPGGRAEVRSSSVVFALRLLQAL
jgi:nicotinamide-nucleotide amidase